VAYIQQQHQELETQNKRFWAGIGYSIRTSLCNKSPPNQRIKTNHSSMHLTIAACQIQDPTAKKFLSKGKKYKL
jgi:hypothetical protein